MLRLYSNFTLSNAKPTRNIRASSDSLPLSRVEEAKTERWLRSALRNHCYIETTEKPTCKGKLIKKPTKPKPLKRRPMKLGNSRAKSLPKMLLSASFSSESRASPTLRCPAVIINDETDNPTPDKTSDILSRAPSISDYPALRIKVELIKTPAKISPPKMALQPQSTAPKEEKPRAQSCMKGSKVKTARHAHFRPAVVHDPTPNHFIRARPGSRLV